MDNKSIISKQQAGLSDIPNITPLFDDLCNIINKARSEVASNANYAVTLMYWHIGERINYEVLDNQRAVYGKQIVSQVATQLSWSHFIELLPILFQKVCLRQDRKRVYQNFIRFEK